MPTRDSASSRAASQPQSTDPPFQPDVQWRRLYDTLARMRGLSSALRIITDPMTSDAVPEQYLDIGGDAAFTVAEILEELSLAAADSALTMFHTASPRIHDAEVMREARRQGALRPGL